MPPGRRDTPGYTGIHWDTCPRAAGYTGIHWDTCPRAAGYTGIHRDTLGYMPPGRRDTPGYTGIHWDTRGYIRTHTCFQKLIYFHRRPEVLCWAMVRPEAVSMAMVCPEILIKTIYGSFAMVRTELVSDRSLWWVRCDCIASDMRIRTEPCSMLSTCASYSPLMLL